MEAVAKRMKLNGEKPFVITKEMWEGKMAEVKRLVPPPGKKGESEYNNRAVRCRSKRFV